MAAFEVITEDNTVESAGFSFNSLDPTKSLVAIRMSIRNPTSSPLTAANFRLAIDGDSFHANDIEPRIAPVGFTLFVGRDPLAKFKDRFLYEKALTPIPPGGITCGWLLFFPSHYISDEISHKKHRLTVSFWDTRGRRHVVSTPVPLGQGAKPLRESSCSEQPFDTELLAALTVAEDHPELLRSLIAKRNEEYLQTKYPLGYAIFASDPTDKVVLPLKSELENYAIDWSQVTTHIWTDHFEITLPGVKTKNGRSIGVTNVRFSGPKEVGPWEGGAPFSDGNNAVAMWAEVLSIEKDSVFAIGFTPFVFPKLNATKTKQQEK